VEFENTIRYAKVLVLGTVRNYCLSNAMHGQNINLPVYVCLSVCPSHFLSTRPQVRPLNGFIDSLKDADLHKDMPFGGLDDK